MKNDAGAGYNIGWTRAGEWLAYTVDINSAGRYNFAFRVASKGAGGRFHLELDGQNVSGALTIPNTGGWQVWQTMTQAITLPTGRHVLRLVMDSVGASGSIGNINYVDISPAPSSTTATIIRATAETAIQAEDFDPGAEGVAYHDVESANLGGAYRQTGVDIQPTSDPGGGFNVGWTKAGEWLNYVSVEKAGVYDFSFRVASPGIGGTFHLELDGQNLTGPMSVPSSGSWQSYKTITRTGVNLPAAGTHVLRLVMDSVGATGSVGNFNFMKVMPASAMPVEVTVDPDAAAHVRDGPARDLNFGSSPTLEVKKSTNGYNREAFARFDLSAGYSINGAKLRLFGGLTDTIAPQISVGVFDVAEEAWDEATLTWSNRPALGASIATVSIAGTTARWYEIDVTNYLKAEKAAGRDIVTLALRSNTATSTLCQFNSDEAAANRPQLVIMS